MSKSIVEKYSITIKGILNIDDGIIVEIEDGEAKDLSEVLRKFNGSAVTISVTSNDEIA